MSTRPGSSPTPSSRRRNGEEKKENLNNFITRDADDRRRNAERGGHGVKMWLCDGARAISPALLERVSAEELFRRSIRSRSEMEFRPVRLRARSIQCRALHKFLVNQGSLVNLASTW